MARAPAVIGRENELRLIQASLNAAQDGQGGAVFLVGEPGIGKSRLAAAAADLGFAAGMSIMRGRGSAIGPMVPFRALIWLMQLKNGEVEGVKTPVGILPAKGELNTDGLDIDPGDLDTLLTIDTTRWKQEMGFRQAHLEQFADLPEEIWAAHRRVAADLEE